MEVFPAFVGDILSVGLFERHPLTQSFSKRDQKFIYELNPSTGFAAPINSVLPSQVNFLDRVSFAFVRDDLRGSGFNPAKTEDVRERIIGIIQVKV